MPTISRLCLSLSNGEHILPHKQRIPCDFRRYPEGLAEKFRKAANDAAYAVGYGYGKVRSAAQDVAQKPEVQKAVDNAKRAMGDAADKAVPAVKQAASNAAAKAAPVARQVASSAAATVRKAGSAATAAVADVATKNAASMRDADTRPHTVIDPTTGQKVTVEAYVRCPDGSHDYDAVYPRGTKSDFGPVGNKLVGTLLILAGVPMLVLPGPGVAAIAAGLYFWRLDDASSESAAS